MNLLPPELKLELLRSAALDSYSSLFALSSTTQLFHDVLLANERHLLTEAIHAAAKGLTEIEVSLAATLAIAPSRSSTVATRYHYMLRNPPKPEDSNPRQTIEDYCREHNSIKFHKHFLNHIVKMRILKRLFTKAVKGFIKRRMKRQPTAFEALEIGNSFLLLIGDILYQRLTGRDEDWRLGIAEDNLAEWLNFMANQRDQGQRELAEMDSRTAEAKDKRKEVQDIKDACYLAETAADWLDNLFLQWEDMPVYWYGEPAGFVKMVMDEVLVGWDPLGRKVNRVFGNIVVLEKITARDSEDGHTAQDEDAGVELLGGIVHWF